jgi:hypothetical protein
MWQTFVTWWIFCHVVGTDHFYKYWPLVPFPPTVGRCDVTTYQVKTFIASSNVCRINQSWKHYDKSSLGFFYSAELLARSSDTHIAATWFMKSRLIILCVYSWTFTIHKFCIPFLGHLSFPLSAICLAYECPI